MQVSSGKAPRAQNQTADGQCDRETDAEEIEGLGTRFEARKKQERGLIEEKKEDSLED